MYGLSGSKITSVETATRVFLALTLININFLASFSLRPHLIHTECIIQEKFHKGENWVSIVSGAGFLINCGNSF